jgi:hypothetical protein
MVQYRVGSILAVFFLKTPKESLSLVQNGRAVFRVLSVSSSLYLLGRTETLCDLVFVR